MKQLITILLLLIGVCSYGQGHDTAGKVNNLRYNKGVTAFGQELIIPRDTIVCPYWDATGAIAVKDGVFYYNDGVGFMPVSGGADTSAVKYDDSNRVYVTPHYVDAFAASLRLKEVLDSVAYLDSVKLADTAISLHHKIDSVAGLVPGSQNLLSTTHAGNETDTTIILNGYSAGQIQIEVSKRPGQPSAYLQQSQNGLYQFIVRSGDDGNKILLSNLYTYLEIDVDSTTQLRSQHIQDASGDMSLTHTYTFTSQTSVVVNHGLGKYPVIQVYNTTGALVTPTNIVQNTLNQFTVTFASSTSGTIIYMR